MSNGSALSPEPGYPNRTPQSEFQLAGGDFDAPDAQGFTALHRVASAGRPADFRALAEAGADIGAKSRSGRLTGLQVAVRWRAGLAVANALLAAGAEVDATDMRGWTALHWAARAKRTDPAMGEAVLGAGAEVNLHDNIGHTALQHATRADIRHEAVAILLRAAVGVYTCRLAMNRTLQQTSDQGSRPATGRFEQEAPTS